ncbi:hypothetical protein SDC9_167467 [bioreactor metagenome]|uniref:Uncharacterized protein n=1 Tax=bioreactor metagenome TaxID=1076179 RepID=A0A645G2G5_9ZZZZ
MTVEMPSKTFIVPNVARMAGILNLEMRMPLKKPMTKPLSMQTEVMIRMITAELGSLPATLRY